MDIFQSLQNYADMNYLIDVEDKLPIFACSIGAHLFNAMNKCSMCDFDPDLVDILHQHLDDILAIKKAFTD